MNKARREQIQKPIDRIIAIKEDIQAIQSEEEDAFDNIPESLQDSLRGSQSQDAIDSLGEAIESTEEAIDSLNEASY